MSPLSGLTCPLCGVVVALPGDQGPLSSRRPEGQVWQKSGLLGPSWGLWVLRLWWRWWWLPGSSGALSQASARLRAGVGVAGGLGRGLKGPLDLPSGISRSRLRGLKSPEQPRGLAGSRAGGRVDNKTNAVLTGCCALNPPGRQDDVDPNRLLNS